MKLSHRLAELQFIVLTAQEKSPYDHIWDCCCDHGYLGISLLNALRSNKSGSKTSQIHFVDIVSHLIEQLNESLSAYALDPSKTDLSSTPWHTHCLDTRDIPLNQHQGKHLVIIAGVGGVQTQEFIQQLCNNNPNQAFDVLLCPVHQLYPLRSTLNTQGFGLIEEHLIKENKRYYEVIYASHPYDAAAKTNITLTGDKIWQSNSKEEEIITKEYLHKLIQHYQKMLKGKLPDSNEHTEIQHILRDYQRLL